MVVVAFVVVVIVVVMMRLLTTTTTTTMTMVRQGAGREHGAARLAEAAREGRCLIHRPLRSLCVMSRD